jgi:hypothetical protein
VLPSQIQAAGGRQSATGTRASGGSIANGAIVLNLKNAILVAE